jgi:hypothetical protein
LCDVMIQVSINIWVRLRAAWISQKDCYRIFSTSYVLLHTKKESSRNLTPVSGKFFECFIAPFTWEQYIQYCFPRSIRFIYFTERLFTWIRSIQEIVERIIN